MCTLTCLAELKIIHCNENFVCPGSPWELVNSCYNFKQLPCVLLLALLQKMTLHNLPHLKAMLTCISSLSGPHTLSLHNIRVTNWGPDFARSPAHLLLCTQAAACDWNFTKLQEQKIEHCYLNDLPSCIKLLTSMHELMLVVPTDMQDCRWEYSRR